MDWLCFPMTAIIFLPNHYSSITLPVLHGGLFPLCPLPSNLDRPFWLPSLIHCGRSNQYEFWVMSQKHTRFYLALSGCSFLEPCVHVVRKRKQPMKRLTWRGTRVPHLQPVWAFSEQPHRYASHLGKLICQSPAEVPKQCCMEQRWGVPLSPA